MTSVDFIAELFYRVVVELEQEQLIEKHPICRTGRSYFD